MILAQGDFTLSAGGACLQLYAKYAFLIIQFCKQKKKRKHSFRRELSISDN